MVQDHKGDHSSLNAAIQSIAGKIRCSGEPYAIGSGRPRATRAFWQAKIARNVERDCTSTARPRADE